MDLISRQAAIEVIEAGRLTKLIEAEVAINGLRALPSAQQWIPTSKKLPDGISQAIVQTNCGAIHEAFYKGKNGYGHEVWMRLDGSIYWDDEVVAWMLLPEPWNGKQNEERKE